MYQHRFLCERTSLLPFPPMQYTGYFPLAAWCCDPAAGFTPWIQFPVGFDGAARKLLVTLLITSVADSTGVMHAHTHDTPQTEEKKKTERTTHTLTLHTHSDTPKLKKKEEGNTHTHSVTPPKLKKEEENNTHTTTITGNTEQQQH